MNSFEYLVDTLSIFDEKILELVCQIIEKYLEQI